MKKSSLSAIPVLLALGAATAALAADAAARAEGEKLTIPMTGENRAAYYELEFE